ncbi:MAG: colanic acid biosynthesis glycosyltransferase WcaI [Hymenobacter sp.]|nr:MAG: colanic acid biosynthesis glycosyltransferase WcaI [Hymenobacter sp.]
MKKRILLVGYNYFPEPTGIGKYSGEMMHWLAAAGYTCEVITAYPYYPFWKVQEPYYAKRYGYHKESYDFASGGSITIHRCPMYIPEKPSGLKRMLLDLSFSISAFFKIAQISIKKPFDCIIAVAPSFQFGLLGVFYKKIKGAKFVYHVHDMQIEVAQDLKMIKSKSIIDLLFKVEKYIFNKSDIISSISEQMVNRIKVKANKDVLLFPNWVDNTKFFPLKDKGLLKQSFGFSPQDKIILYSGGIGEKQGLESIVFAAKEFAHQPEVKFLICGSGPYKEKLMALVSEMSLSNITFFPLQPVEKFNAFLNMADLHLVIQKANASDLMMPSKLTTILAVGGLALITANEGSGLHMLVQNHQVGVLAEAENQLALNEAISYALYAPTDDLRRNAQQYAENYLFIDKIMSEFVKHLN